VKVPAISRKLILKARPESSAGQGQEVMSFSMPAVAAVFGSRAADQFVLL
jgi:hypothetical protein